LLLMIDGYSSARSNVPVRRQGGIHSICSSEQAFLANRLTTEAPYAKKEELVASVKDMDKSVYVLLSALYVQDGTTVKLDIEKVNTKYPTGYQLKSTKPSAFLSFATERAFKKTRALGTFA
jgi:hypothetical protein